jgi:hypothetical protein
LTRVHSSDKVGLMARTHGDIDWERIHGLSNYVETGDCWRECGSYCCKTNHAEFSFRFIRAGQVLLPLCPAEYDYLKAQGRLPDDSPQAVSRLAVELEPDRSAAVYMVRCDRGGLCDHPDFRPLICKIYPYYPYPSPEGDVEELVLGSVFDVARWAKDGHLACPALQNEEEAVRGKAKQNYARLFEHPHLIFYFRMGWGVMQLMLEHLRAEHSDILELPLTDYFKKWEVLYMTGKLTPAPEVVQLGRKEYEKVSRVWGDFDLE